MIGALSMLSVGERPLREVLVYRAQGVIVSLYGWYRLRLAQPVSVQVGSAARSGRNRLRMRPRRARDRGQIARPVRS
jgi:hypothetical protein